MATRSFANKVVLITGGSAGIGKATAKHFAKLGASVALTGRDKNKLEEVAQDCKSLGSPEVLGIQAEFTKEEDIKKTMDETIKKFSKLDILVNNVGILLNGNLASASMWDFDFLFSINVKSVLFLTKLAMPYLVLTKGNIVNVSSRSTISHASDGLFYGMTKASLDHLTKTVALEYAPKGVRVNSVNPGYVIADIFRNLLSEKETENFFEDANSRYPIGRCGKPDDIANAIAFLASNDSEWTTGQCLFLDGGKSLEN